MIAISEKEAIIICGAIETCWDEWGDLTTDKCKLLKRIFDMHPEIQKRHMWLYEEVNKRV